jgi:hypothetical protein
MNEEYIKNLTNEYHLKLELTDTDCAYFTLIGQKSDSMRLCINFNGEVSVDVLGSDLAYTIASINFSSIPDAIDCLTAFNDYYNLVIVENFKMFLI